MTDQDLLRIAMAQSAQDLGCDVADFFRDTPVIGSGPTPRAKAIYSADQTVNLVSYGGNVVAAAKPEYRDIVAEYLAENGNYHAFETPALNTLSERLAPYGQKAFFMSEFYLPKLDGLRPLPCAYELRVLHPADFTPLYTAEWANALCADRPHLDMLGVGAYDAGKLVGFAACSADAADMWQIGVDVLPAYRRQGIASALTSRLALEILDCGKVPFYCTAWSNLRSVRNAFKCGFVPTWVELNFKPQ